MICVGAWPGAVPVVLNKLDDVKLDDIKLDDSRLSAEVKGLRVFVKDAYPLKELGAARAECLAWLKAEYLH